MGAELVCKISVIRLGGSIPRKAQMLVEGEIPLVVSGQWPVHKPASNLIWSL